jgi:hypothetical protein
VRISGSYLSQFLSKEYKLRNPKYSVNIDDMTFLLNLNLTLQTEEQKIYQNADVNHPFIFVFGVPRSGTTVLTQLLSYCLDVGYINNLIARFWLAPVCGIRLSKILLGNSKRTSFESEYARTKDLWEPHEFAYFWQYWLKKQTIADYLAVDEKEQDIDWIGFRRTMLNIQAAFNKSMVFKNIIGVDHLNKLSDVLEKTLWIYIKRDPMDCAVSIFKARQKFYADVNTWWSTYPPEYMELKGLPYWEQIGGQIYCLCRFYEARIAGARNQNTLVVTYRELCDDPKVLLSKVVTKIKELYSYDLAITNAPPEQFDFSTASGDFPEYEKLQRGLAKFRS